MSSSFCCCSVTQSCPTLCDPMDFSIPGFPILHYLPEFAQTHVHWIDDTIQPSHPLLLPSNSNIKKKIYFCMCERHCEKQSTNMNSLLFPVSLHFMPTFVSKEIKDGEVWVDLFCDSLRSLHFGPGSFPIHHSSSSILPLPRVPICWPSNEMSGINVTAWIGLTMG